MQLFVCLPYCGLPPSGLIRNKHEQSTPYGVNLQSACPHMLNIGGVRGKRTRAKSSIFYVVPSLARCRGLCPLPALGSQVRTVDALGLFL